MSRNTAQTPRPPSIPAKLGANEKTLRRLTHTTIKRVTDDAGSRFNFNTAISAIMELVNGIYQYREKEQGKDAAVLTEAIENLVLLLAPFTPHITEELWQAIGHTDSVHRQAWPVYDTKAMAQEEVTIVIQINGKMRDRLTMPGGSRPG